MGTKLKEEAALARINQVRRCLHIHSVLYYHLSETIVSDSTFDEWSRELVTLQERYPRVAKLAYRDDLFFNWTGATGFHLTPNTYSINRARWLLTHQGSA